MLTHIEAIRYTYKRWKALPVPRMSEPVDSRTLERYLKSACFAGQQSGIATLWRIGYALERSCNEPLPWMVEYYYKSLASLYKALYSCLTTEAGFNAPYYIGEANICITEMMQYGNQTIE